MSYPANIGVRGIRLIRVMEAFLDRLDQTAHCNWEGLAPCRLIPPALGRSEPPGTLVGVPDARRVLIVTQFFLPGEPSRLREIQRALALNCSNEVVAGIYLLVERPYTDEELGIVCAKITQEVIGRRLTFADVFGGSWGRKAGGGAVCILANADISFDSSISAAQAVDLTNHVLCLRRTEVNTSGTCASPVYAQDAWVWNGMPMDNVKCDFEVGRSGCDNRLVHELLRGGKVPTAFDRVKAWHHHRASERPARAVGRIDGPYLGLVPLQKSGMHPTGDALALAAAIGRGPLIAANLCSGGGRVAHWGSNPADRPSAEAREEGIRGYLASDNYGAELYGRLYTRGLRACTHLLRPAPWEKECVGWATALAEGMDSDVVHLHSDAAAHLNHPLIVDLVFGRSPAMTDTKITLQKSLVAEGPFIERYGKLCEMLSVSLADLPPGCVVRLALGAFSVPLLAFLAQKSISAVCLSEIRVGVKREVTLRPRLVG